MRECTFGAARSRRGASFRRVRARSWGAGRKSGCWSFGASARAIARSTSGESTGIAARSTALIPAVGMHVDDIEVRALFRQAMAHDDETAMRQGIELLLGLSDGRGLSAEQEYAVRHPEYTMEMPQFNERIRGRDAMRAMQETFPTPPGVRLRRVHGSGRTWVIEGVNDYDGDVWNVVLILELDDDGRILRDTRYYGQRSAPPQ